MEPLNNWASVWWRVFWNVYTFPPRSQARGSVYDHLWNRFDLPFIDEDK